MSRGGGISPEVPLATRFQALVWEKEEVMESSLELERGDDTKKAQLRTQITTSATKRMQRVLVIEDSLLRHTEAHIFCPDNLSREACSLPAAHVRDVKRTIT